MRNLFQSGQFVLNSGDVSLWKIECDALTDSDIETIASMLVPLLWSFSHVEGVPRGGERLAEALRVYQTPGNGGLLIVDDVLTTGGSMERQRRCRAGVQGAVIFARQRPKSWITPLFQMPTSRKKPRLHRLFNAEIAP